MRVLLIDSTELLDASIVSALLARGHEVIATQSAVSAVDLMQDHEFDCMFIDVEAAGDALGLVELRLLARRSALALMASSPVDLLVAESLAKGNIEFRFDVVPDI